MKLVIFIIFIVGCLVGGFLLRNGVDKLLQRIEEKNINKEQ